MEDAMDILVAAAPCGAYVAAKFMETAPLCEERLANNFCVTLAVGAVSMYLLGRGVYVSRESAFANASMLALAAVLLSRPILTRYFPEERRADTVALALALLCVNACMQSLNSSKRVYAVPALTWITVLLARC